MFKLKYLPIKFKNKIAKMLLVRFNNNNNKPLKKSKI